VREAVARCPGCSLFYCRECVVEHDGKLFCVACLKPKAAPPKQKNAFGNVWKPALGFLTGWAVLYWLAQILLMLPTAFHDK
jgi:hypothetical protein